MNEDDKIADATPQNNDLPNPKHKIGDTIFFPGIIQVTEKAECPDCSGKKIWHVRTPNGTEFDVPCARCSHSGYSNLPSLNVCKWKGIARSFVVKSIDVKSSGSHMTEERYRPRITYYDNVGCCGHTVEQEKICEDEAEAFRKGEELAAAENERYSKTKQGEVQTKRSALNTLNIAQAVAADRIEEANKQRCEKEEVIDFIRDLPSHDCDPGTRFLGELSIEREPLLKKMAIFILKELDIELPEEWQE